jgi:hypothetical protein
MALTEYQCSILRLLASERKVNGEYYLAGGAALNALLSAPPLSRDLDLFHDTEEAISVSWQADRQTIEMNGNTVTVIREAPSFIEAVVIRDSNRTVIQWARDSAFRFFPLIEDELLGLALHPFDLATNKVLAMVGRLEVRDWVDVITCDQELQPFGYLVWAACGKDPGYNPQSLLDWRGVAEYQGGEPSHRLTGVCLCHPPNRREKNRKFPDRHKQGSPGGTSTM